jgi:hypothetical protein
MRKLTISLRALSVGIAFCAIPVGAQQTLNVSVAGPGKVTGTGIDCPKDCSETMLPTYIGLRRRPATAQTVVLTAQPAPNAFFIGWTGCPGTDLACTVTVPSGGANVSARFGTESVLRVNVDGPGTIEAEGISCPENCVRTVQGTFTVTLRALPKLVAPGFQSAFDRWAGACQGNSTICTVEVRGPVDVSAFFMAPSN